MSSDLRAGCCADWPKPCGYHEGWLDGFDVGQETGCEHDGPTIEQLEDALLDLEQDVEGADRLVEQLRAALEKHRAGHEALGEFCSICHEALRGDR